MNIKHMLNRLEYQYRTNKEDFVRVIIKTVNPLEKIKDYNDDKKYRLITKDKKSIRKNILGNLMVLPTDDQGLSKDLILYGIREPLSTKIFLKECHKDMKIIDIGANIGYYLLMEAKITNKGKGKIWGIEPNPRSFNILKRNVRINNYKNVTFFNKCIGDQDGKTDFYISNQWNSSRIESGSPRINEDLDKLHLPMNKLDTLFSKNKIDLIRMDVEGYEKKIFEGMGKILKKNPHMKIFFEYHPIFLNKKEKNGILNFIKNNNFKIKYFINERRGKIIKNFPVDKLNKENFTYGISLFLER